MKIIPRRPYRDEEPDGYLESDHDFVLNNLNVALAMLEPLWSKEWPTEPGYYWFYGWLSRSRTHRDFVAPKMYQAKIVQTYHDVKMRTFSYVIDGNKLNEEYALGLWTPAFPPEAPDLSELMEEE